MTVIESGVDVTAGAYVLFAVPKGLDPALLSCLEGVLDEAINSDSYKELMTNLDSTPINLGPAATLEFIKKGAATYEKLFAER
jgi:tripartite-type tricarboxylate transporter receptor subunit TctC